MCSVYHKTLNGFSREHHHQLKNKIGTRSHYILLTVLELAIDHVGRIEGLSASTSQALGLTVCTTIHILYEGTSGGPEGPSRAKEGELGAV